jgi:hypothetical protein
MNQKLGGIAATGAAASRAAATRHQPEQCAPTNPISRADRNPHPAQHIRLTKNHSRAEARGPPSAARLSHVDRIRTQADIPSMRAGEVLDKAVPHSADLQIAKRREQPGHLFRLFNHRLSGPLGATFWKHSRVLPWTWPIRPSIARMIASGSMPCQKEWQVEVHDRVVPELRRRLNVATAGARQGCSSKQIFSAGALAANAAISTQYSLTLASTASQRCARTRGAIRRAKAHQAAPGVRVADMHTTRSTSVRVTGWCHAGAGRAGREIRGDAAGAAGDAFSAEIL